MKKLFSLLLVVLVFGTAFAGNGLLWKVAGNGLTKPSYVLGSHHMVPATFVDSIAGLSEAIDAVDALYGEVTKDELNASETQQRIMTFAMAPADSTLSKVLSPEELQRLDSLLQGYTGMPGMAAQLEPFKPALVCAQLSMLQLMKEFPEFQTQQPFDAVVLALGEQRGKAMGGLETPESQMLLLFNDPVSLQAKDLVEAVEKNELQIRQMKELTESYLKQDLDAVMAVMTNPECGITPADLERLLYRRNRAWAETLKEVLPQQSVLVVVGAAHLGGDQGLLNLLRKQGFTVTPATE